MKDGQVRRMLTVLPSTPESLKPLHSTPTRALEERLGRSFPWPWISPETRPPRLQTWLKALRLDPHALETQVVDFRMCLPHPSRREQKGAKDLVA